MMTTCSVKFSRGLGVSAEFKLQMSAFDEWFWFKLSPVLAGKLLGCWNVQAWRNTCVVVTLDSTNLMVGFGCTQIYLVAFFPRPWKGDA